MVILAQIELVGRFDRADFYFVMSVVCEEVEVLWNRYQCSCLPKEVAILWTWNEGYLRRKIFSGTETIKQYLCDTNAAMSLGMSGCARAAETTSCMGSCIGLSARSKVRIDLCVICWPILPNSTNLASSFPSEPIKEMRYLLQHVFMLVRRLL